jgi:hypothetical protein
MAVGSYYRFDLSFPWMNEAFDITDNHSRKNPTDHLSAGGQTWNRLSQVFF